MIKLTCFACGLSVPYRMAQADVCPRCLARRQHAVVLVPVSDRPSTYSRLRAGRLRIEARSREDRLVLVLSGELDISSAPLLEEELTDACQGESKDVVIDLTGVEFIDSIGLSAILRGKTLCEEHDCGYYLTPGQPQAQRLFEATGVIDRLGFRQSGSADTGASS
jgi:anti-sigma B factor antagonist